MEHVKLARRDARRRAEERSRGPRGWAVAASMALGATCAFVGVALWLGMNGAKSTQVRTQAPHIAGRSRHPLPPALVTPPVTPPPTPGPTTVYPRPKKRRGQIQKVRPETNETTPRATTSTSTSTSSTSTSTSTTSTSTTTTTSTTSTTTPPTPVFLPETPDFEPETLSVETRTPVFEQETPAFESESPSLEDVEIRGPSEQDVYFPKLDVALEETFRDVLQNGALTPPPPPPPPPPPTQPPSQSSSTLSPTNQSPAIPQSRHPVLPFRHDVIHDDRDPLLAPPPPPYPYEVSEPENPFLALVRDRIDATKSWLSSVGAGKDWVDLAGAVNESFHLGDVSPALAKLSQMYRETSASSARPPPELSNPASLASLGLLAFDVLLLRNVQLLARSEEGPSGDVARELFRDREVRALGALFMPPREARRLMKEDSLEDRADSPASSDVSVRDGAIPVSDAPSVANPADPANPDSSDDDDDDDDRELTLGDVVREVSSFVTSAVRAVLNVGRAYRRSLTFSSGKAVSARRDEPRTPLDCMWTLYCRNLDKTARLSGPYGFLAKLNGLGLRLLLNAVPLDQAVDVLVKEASNGWGHIDCKTLFPRCSAEEAVPTVLRTAVAGPSLL